MEQRDFEIAMDVTAAVELKTLSVERYSIEGEPGLSNPVSLPQSLINRAVMDFFEVERHIKGLWNPETARPIEIPDKPNNDYYTTFALQFTRAYFFKNLLKSLICNEILRYHIGGISEFTDLGAGSGPFSVALAQSFEPSKLELLDRSETQLEIAGRVFQKLKPNVSISLKNMNITDFDARDKNCVASYAMGESMQNGINIFKAIRDAATFTLIDSPLVVRGVNDYLKPYCFPVLSGYITFTTGIGLSHLIEGNGGHFCFLHKASSVTAKSKYL